ncbi:MAG: P-loop NTPase, partial [Candidatus Omnitrophica bacterium]|nr:P-loop NTPase [Candidatus Omnitrophota bacterium]
GDAQLTLTQSAPLSGAVIVTTPQEVSLIDARKGLKMFQKVKVPVLGIIENMSHFICSDCGKRTNIFKTGGGERAAKELGIPFLGEIPLDAEVSESGDMGTPIVVKNPSSPISKVYNEIAGRVAAQLSIVNMQATGLPSDFKMTWKTVPS